MSEPSKAHELSLWRGALLPSGLVSLTAIILGAVIRGAPGFWGALFASSAVLLFLSVHLIISKLSEKLDPFAVMALAMFSYFAKVMLMASLLLVVSKLTAPETVDRATFAVTAIAITASWLLGEIVAFTKLRFQLPLPQTTDQKESVRESIQELEGE